MLTGGEPRLKPTLIYETVRRIREASPRSQILLYTAMTRRPVEFLGLLSLLDGVTLTLHTQEDVKDFLIFDDMFSNSGVRPSKQNPKSLRLNIFKGITLPEEWLDSGHPWWIKDEIEWIEDCTLPSNEVFMRL